jgi:hypothetical protein
MRDRNSDPCDRFVWVFEFDMDTVGPGADAFQGEVVDELGDCAIECGQCFLLYCEPIFYSLENLDDAFERIACDTR